MIKPNGSRLKILVLGDDPRIPSGVGVMTEAITRGFVKEGWEVFCLGGAMRERPEQLVMDEIGRKILPIPGYGDIMLIRQVIAAEKPDIMWIMTDPRYWTWLWAFENEIRIKMPLIYYHVWDDIPAPKYNDPYYESCDEILCISKLSYDIVKEAKKRTKANYRYSYIPHGIDLENYKPLPLDTIIENPAEMPKWINENKDKPEEQKSPKPIISLTTLLENLKNVNENVRKNKSKIKFIVFWNNRNIRRKMPTDVVSAFARFAKDKKDVMLIMHTDPVDQHGTDIPRMIDDLFPDAPIVIAPQKVPKQVLASFYNLCQCTINIGSAEGFGLSSAESLACGIPIINILTGGLQDQVSFTENGIEKFTGICIDPDAVVTVGSPPTPYIYERYVDIDSIVKALQEMYDIYKNNPIKYEEFKANARRKAELEFDEKIMVQKHIDSVKSIIKTWEPRKRWEMFQV